MGSELVVWMQYGIYSLNIILNMLNIAPKSFYLDCIFK